jgi:hypothetical protein
VSTYNRGVLPVTRLPLEAQTAYAELLSTLLARQHEGRAASIVEKTIGGRVYLYVQERALGGMRQSYLGSDTPEVRARAQELTAGWQNLRAQRDRRALLVKLARAAGCVGPTAPELKLLETLAQGAVFGMGGVLVGTHAFAALMNALGVTADLTALRTADVDLVHDPRVMVAFDETQPVMSKLTTDGIDGLRLWPIPGFDPRVPSTSFEVHGSRLRLDLLTPMRGRSEAPVHIPALGASALPLRYLDYLVEESQPGAVVGGAGVLVNLPDPARFALHKLLVADVRGSAFATKARKDLLQSEALLRALLTDRPEDVRAAWSALAARGPGWAKHVRRSLTRLEGDVRARLAALCAP